MDKFEVILFLQLSVWLENMWMRAGLKFTTEDSGAQSVMTDGMTQTPLWSAGV